MKRFTITLISAFSAAFLVAAVYLLAPTDSLPPNDEPQAHETESRENPGYYDQWFDMKKNDEGIIPRGMNAKWYTYDQQMRASRSRRRMSGPIKEVNFMGPHDLGGRTRALLVHAADEDILLAGAASGGIWRSENAGASWTPLDDAAVNLAVSGITQSPFDSDIIYYGTGEFKGSTAGISGDGVFKSTDGGLSFNQLPSSAGIYNLNTCAAIQHSKDDPNEVYVGTKDGLYRTQNGGTNWSPVYNDGLITDIICFSDGGVMFSKLGEEVFYSPTGDFGSYDTLFFPHGPWWGLTYGRIEIAEYPGNEDIVYAAFAKLDGTACQSFFRSTDRGQVWTKESTPPVGSTQGGYAFMLGVSQSDPNRVVCGATGMRHSTNGGDSWLSQAKSHADYHTFANYANQPDSFLVGNDGGIYRYAWSSLGSRESLNDGYHSSQFYGGDHAPSSTTALGGTQDNGTWRVHLGGELHTNGADGGFAYINQQNPDIAYTSQQEGRMFRSENFLSLNPTWTLNNTNPAMDAEKYQFINAYQINHTDGDQLYCRTNVALWRTENRGVNWTKLTNDTILKIFPIGITPETDPDIWLGGRNGVFYYIANARTAAQGSEVDLRSSLPAHLHSDNLGCIALHPADNTTLYVSFVDYDPSGRVWKVTNANTLAPVWEDISGDLPLTLPVNYVQADPAMPDDVLYAATDFGMYYTVNGGQNWIKESRVPNVPILECKLREFDRRLFLFTHGRGVWHLELSDQPCANKVTVFPYRQSFETDFGDWVQDDDDDFDWSRRLGSTPSAQTGPSGASDGALYIYTESSTPNHPQKVANLTACFDFSTLDAPEMTFDYSMNGSTMGALNLMASANAGITWDTIWTQSGNQRDFWWDATIDLSAYANEEKVTLCWNAVTGTSYRSDMALDNISIHNTCTTLDFNELTVHSSTGQDFGTSTIQDGGATLLLQNNAWKYIDFPYDIGPDTYIEFDFRSTLEGEIHGIELRSFGLAGANYAFKVHGTQNWGIVDFDNYVSPNWTTYTINVGAYFTGYFDRMVFICDKDANPQLANSQFRNVRIFEEECGNAGPPAGFVVGSKRVLNEGEGDVQPDISVFPNPFTEQVTVEIPVEWTGETEIAVFAPSGRLIVSESGNFAGAKRIFSGEGLATGVYHVRVTSGAIVKYEKLVKLK